MYILLMLLDLGANVQDRANRIPNGIDDTYRGMSFDAWLDIFMEFAICLAKRGKLAESYELCQAAKDCVVFFHSRNDMFLLHLCWCSTPPEIAAMGCLLIFDSVRNHLK
jgi:general transcription factor 3C polypeptide 3 (transcription factor C subunit 4)